MAIYEIIKDCISTAQKVDNIPLVQSLIEVQTQVDEEDGSSLMRKNNKLIKEK